MSSRSLRSLVVKDVREIAAGRACWLLLLASGLLTGHAFMTAVSTYAEMSGATGGPHALAQGLNPLDGIVVPTLGVLSLAATFLLPFVAIRMFAHERQSGAWKLLLQGPFTVRTMVAVKAAVLCGAWFLAWVPALSALLLWRAYGNHLYAPEVLSVLLGHALFSWLTIGIAAAAAAITSAEASAAILALAFTIGTWALDFAGAARGGMLHTIAASTPTAALQSFEHGLIRVDATLVLLAVGTAGLAIAVIWLDTGIRKNVRWLRTSVVIVLAFAVAATARLAHATFDVSEDRRSSFAAADEAMLRRIHENLHVSAALAPEDPRRADLQRNILDKLARVLPRVDVTYTQNSGTGIFAAPAAGYGEIRYELGGKTAMSRSTTEPIVLELIYDLAGLPVPPVTESMYPGYPLVDAPRGAGWMFFAGWPLLLGVALLVSRRRHR